MIAPWFLPEEHPYRRVAFAFNGKRERTQRPPIMTLAEWLIEHEREKEKEFIEMFDSNREPSMIQNSSTLMLRNFPFG